METLKQLQQEFAEASQNYESIKKETEAKVIEWFWASDWLFSLEPYYFEENKFSKGRKLKEEPEEKENKFQYGIDNNGEIIVERQYTGLKDLYYETFIVRNPNKIVSYRYDYGSQKININIKLFLYENSTLTTSYTIVKDGWVEYTYRYENGRLTSRLMQRISDNKPIPKRLFTYTYDELGILGSIQEGEHYWYKKPDKSLNYAKLSELASNKLFDVLRQTLASNPVDEKLFCIYIHYYHTDMFPPSIAYGTEVQRQEWMDEEGEDAKWIIWNPIDYEYVIEPELDSESQKLFKLFNQETELKNKENSAIKIMVECAKKLKDCLPEFHFNTTDDFILVVADYEQADLKKNFKQIYPEKYDEFKKKLI